MNAALDEHHLLTADLVGYLRGEVRMLLFSSPPGFDNRTDVWSSDGGMLDLAWSLHAICGKDANPHRER